MVKKSVFELLSPFMEQGRREKLLEVVNSRSKGVIPVFENLHDPHNLSAVLRSLEGFGLQYIYLTGESIDEINNAVSMGSESWVTLKKEKDLDKLLSMLRSDGYLIAGTSPSSSGMDPIEYKDEKKVALLFGNERMGLSKKALGSCDLIFTIPQCGFTRSLNLSVSAAIFIYSLLKNPYLRSCHLSGEEKKDLLDSWAKKSVSNSERILEEVQKKWYNS